MKAIIDEFNDLNEEFKTINIKDPHDDHQHECTGCRIQDAFNRTYVLPSL